MTTPTQTKAPTKNALVAKSGNHAEDIVCSSADIKAALSQYFGKSIQRIEKIGHRKKSDHRVVFDDGSHTTLQLKNGTGGGRGWSFDRRSVDSLPTANDALKGLVKTVCLTHTGERAEVPNDRELIQRLILGDEDATKPHYFIHTTEKDGILDSLSICPAPVFLQALLSDIYEVCNSKRTCVHLTPLIYLQRKGGGTADHSPNDIQAKLRAMPDCMTVIALQQTTTQ